MKKLLPVLALAIVLVFMVTACGDGAIHTFSEAEYKELLDRIEVLEDEIKELKNGDSNSGSGSGNSLYSSVNVGDIIQFGGLDWRVITVQDGKALILSDKILECREYHETKTDITWEYCTLREFLNDSFYNSTFNAQEKEMILQTDLVNSDNPEYGTEGGNDTKDKIFLLSIDEVNEYMGDSAHINVRNANIAEHFVTGETTWWWLRSPGCVNFSAAYFSYFGSFHIRGYYVSNGSGGVRPALWLNL